ncbi:hypothetical protein [Nonomuraea rhodomycinica]|uniref:Uncharacterized protein n=1 Tax=Nonomuraea rhodomycinica TaxID=1712872 RepID=A0A7Y6ITF7_9ACTN|nr:hypothetical protein [Nonomuraea rhodomycinica]NUW42774.1 hypothetical protein [Nonomuraea rhodomycinica]
MNREVIRPGVPSRPRQGRRLRRTVDELRASADAQTGLLAPAPETAV